MNLVLFSIFINDLDKELINEVLKFADDTMAWERADNADDASKMKEDLKKIEL